MGNERKTENLVRHDLQKCGYEAPAIQVEEQTSGIESVKRLLKTASKSRGGGSGCSEFTISSPNTPDFLLIIECKADPKDHSSDNVVQTPPETEAQRDTRTRRFAVDGVLHYAQFLSKEFHVIAVAISGETRHSLSISTYLWPKNTSSPDVLKTKDGKPINRIIPWADYIEHATFDRTFQRCRQDDLMAFSRELHDFMRAHAIVEAEKPLAVSGTLIALQHPAFAKTFDDYSPEELPDEWLEAIRKVIKRAKIPQAKKERITQPYSNIAVLPDLCKANGAYPKGPLHELIRRLNSKVGPFISVYHDVDVVGQFYGEFLKYSCGDKKSLGIVLTPRHITELFAVLANVNKDSTVLDICTGTGGFLIAAMHAMFKTALTNQEKDRIRRDGLIGVEQVPGMFALAASNMILRGDGKANLYQGNCFDTKIAVELKNHKCDVGMINPPYSQGGLHELQFVQHMLECLCRGAVGIAIVPMSCAITPNPKKTDLLKDHTLKAVMSMPTDLFPDVGVNTCIMVFTAWVPHVNTDQKTWFACWKDDGFTKTKHRGRVDIEGRWDAIRDRWVTAFREREVRPGMSIMRRVTAADEWCAEAYMETDYSHISREEFEEVVRDYAVYQLITGARRSGCATHTRPI